MSQFDEKLAFFFRSPGEPPLSGINQRMSNLYLLRRDILTCFGLNPGNGEPLQHDYKALWPGVMAIMAGVDLLAKFAYGDAQYEVGKRFGQWTRHYLTNQYETPIYQLRNAMLHSFGLYSETSKGIYRFTLTPGYPGQVLVVQASEENYVVNITRLREEFEQGVGRFHEDIAQGVHKQATFLSMFDKYGGTYITQSPR